MGLFDAIRFECPTPVPPGETGAFQTYDTPEQFLDDYKVDKHGLLWHAEYDIEDKSDPNAEGLMKHAGFATRVNERWVRALLTTTLECHGANGTFEAVFVDGVMRVPRAPGQRETAPDERSAPIEILRWITRSAKMDGPAGTTLYFISEELMGLARKKVEEAYGKE